MSTPIGPVGLQRVAHDATLTGDGKSTSNLAVTGAFSGITTTVGNYNGTIITPAITASQNNWNPTDLATATIINLTSSGGTWNITGLAGGAIGRRLTICNANPYGGNAVVLVGLSGSSDADKRFVASNLSTGAGGSEILFPGNKVNVFHNGTNWRIEGQHWMQELTVNGQTTLGTTSSIIGLLTASGGIAANGTNTFNATAGSSTFGDFRGAGIADTIASDQNDYTPPGASPTAALILRLAPSGANRTITGLTGGSTGRFVFMYNTSTTLTLTLSHESASSTAANRFTCPGAVDYVVGAGKFVLAYYFGSRWCLLVQ